MADQCRRELSVSTRQLLVINSTASRHGVATNFTTIRQLFRSRPSLQRNTSGSGAPKYSKLVKWQQRDLASKAVFAAQGSDKMYLHLLLDGLLAHRLLEPLGLHLHRLHHFGVQFLALSRRLIRKPTAQGNVLKCVQCQDNHRKAVTLPYRSRTNSKPTRFYQSELQKGRANKPLLTIQPA